MKVILRTPTDWTFFKHALIRAIQGGVSPDAVQWSVSEAIGAIADHSPELALETGARHGISGFAPRESVILPEGFGRLSRYVVLHRDPERFRMLHAYASRVAGDSEVWLDAIDPERVTLERMAQSVRRDGHKMKAFVRFAPAKEPGPSGEPVHYAWFEPEHFVVHALAKFFARRFTSMRWAIWAPREQVAWDGARLSYGGPARRCDMPELVDPSALWLTYYASTFNPARVNPTMTRREMPERYWKNLPEGQLIPELIAGAERRAAAMADQVDSGRRDLRKSIPAKNDPSLPKISLAMINNSVSRCDTCEHAAFATQGVGGEGRPGARVMLVGEQPGDQEDLAGRPFVGPAGTLLRRAISDLGWSEDEVYITNAVKHFKFELRGKRRIHKTPAQREAEACLSWLEQEIALVQPQVIVALGATAAHSLKTYAEGMRTAIPIAAVEHPAALLRTGRGVGTEGYRAWVRALGEATATALPNSAS